MKSRLSDSAGHKTFAVAVGQIVHTATIRRLPMRPGDNESRYRVRIAKSVLNGKVISSTFRDMDISKAYRVFEQNTARLAALVA